uniref:Uncharacterized protein n=1 Tax=Anguilla anguilla TaxID=7936 RepID=A0A0E9WWL3_ANGAN
MMIIMIIIIANMIMVIRIIYLVCMKAMCLSFCYTNAANNLLLGKIKTKKIIYRPKNVVLNFDLCKK